MTCAFLVYIHEILAIHVLDNYGLRRVHMESTFDVRCISKTANAHHEHSHVVSELDANCAAQKLHCALPSLQ